MHKELNFDRFWYIHIYYVFIISFLCWFTYNTFLSYSFCDDLLFILCFCFILHCLKACFVQIEGFSFQIMSIGDSPYCTQRICTASTPNENIILIIRSSFSMQLQSNNTKHFFLNIHTYIVTHSQYQNIKHKGRFFYVVKTLIHEILSRQE